jgi:hypothetical protein
MPAVKEWAESTDTPLNVQALSGGTMLQASSPILQGTLAVLLAVAGAGQALAASVRAPGLAPTASRQVQAFAAGEGTCDGDRVKEAVSLIYEQDDMGAAANIALRCELLANSEGRPFNRTIASRIKALIAMRTHDMAALKMAGEALVAEAQVPEYVADGHLFIAFACLFGGNPKCAREHVDQAKAMFTALNVADALNQLRPLEQTLSQLEQQDEGR